MLRFARPIAAAVAVAAVCGLAYRRVLAMQPAAALTVVCAGADRVLRGPLPGGGCAPGERPLAGAGAQTPGGTDTGDSRLRLLESRVKELEDQLDKKVTAVRAPFEVFDGSGNRIFRVGQAVAGGSYGAFVYNSAGRVVSLLSAGPGGGVVRAMSDGDENTSVGMGAIGGNPLLVVREGNKARVELGKAPSGRFSLRVNAVNEVAIAAIGEARTGAGLVAINDGAGKPRAVMRFLDDGRAMIGVNSPSEALLASLSQGDSGGGKLQLTDAGGTPMVEAGAANGVGIVRTGPMPRALLPGVPGSFIVGRGGQ